MSTKLGRRTGLVAAPGKAPFEMAGTHRRVAFGELMEYMRRDDQDRRRAADELTELGQGLGQL